VCNCTAQGKTTEKRKLGEYKGADVAVASRRGLHGSGGKLFGKSGAFLMNISALNGLNISVGESLTQEPIVDQFEAASS
jgi:hypothetical protein